MNPRLTPLAAALSIPLLVPASSFAADNLDPVIVTATRQAMRTSELLSDVTVIERKELDAAGQSTLEEVLARQPGLQSAVNGSYGANSSLFLRGTNGNQVLLLIDGMRVGSATTGSPTWSRIPLSQIDRIEILRGPASSLYGNEAIGGVIQVFTHQGDGPPRVHGEFGGGSYDTYEASGGFSGAQDGWRYALNAATYSTGGFNSKPWSPTANKDRDGYWNNSLSARLSHNFTKGHEAGVSLLYSDGENKYDGSGATVDWRNRNSVTSLNSFVKNAISDHWTSTITAGTSIDNGEDLKNGVRNSKFRTDQRQYVWQNDLKTGYGNFLLGAERLEQEIDTTTRYSVRERTNNSLLAGWNLGYQAHRLQANLRHDQNSQFGDKTTGAAAYGYQFSQNWRANIGYGTAFKAPSFNDLYYPLNLGSRGNPNLQPESSRNAEAAMHYEAGLQHVSLTVYHNEVEDLIAWGKMPDGIWTPVNVANARLKGSTLAYDGRIGSFNLTASYDYLDPRDADSGKILPRRARNYGMIALGQRLGPYEWRVEMQASGNRYDDLKNTNRLAGYALVNLYGAYHLSGDWSLFARINNLFDRDYQLAADYATPGLNAFVGLRYAPK